MDNHVGYKHVLGLELHEYHMSLENGGVDLDEGLIVGEYDVVGGEHANKSGIHLVPAATRCSHGCVEGQILKLLPVEILVAVVHAAAFKE